MTDSFFTAFALLCLLALGAELGLRGVVELVSGDAPALAQR